MATYTPQILMEKNKKIKGMKFMFHSLCCILMLFIFSCNDKGNKLTIINGTDNMLKNVRVQYTALSIEDTIPVISPEQSYEYKLKRNITETSVYIEYQNGNKNNRILAIPYLISPENKNYTIKIH